MNKYKNYYSNHVWYSTINCKWLVKKYKCNFGDVFNKKWKNIKILEIWCWMWCFTEFIKNLNIKDYTWIDLDNDSIIFLKEKYPEFHFINISVFDFLKWEDKYDIIFISHVFEHFSIEEWILLSKLIFKSLKSNGVWINIMPNAWSLYYSWYMRYVDITHKTLYSYESFSQILLQSWFQKDKILHKNFLVSCKFYFRFVKTIWIFIHKILLWLIWQSFHKIYTDNLLTIIKK